MALTQDLTQSQLDDRLLAILRCTLCRAPLTPEAEGLTCSRCSQNFPYLRGTWRFVDRHNYAESFGYQWHRYSRTQLDDEKCRNSEAHFRMRTGFRPEDLKGKLILDVGCGMGRFAEVATRWGARVIGVDLSTAAEVAAHNLSDRDFVAFQADVFHLPFALQSFDYIYSIGVLHHTPDCEQAVKVLPQYLKPGGTLAVWLYSAYGDWYRFSDIYRKYTSRMSPVSLHRMLKVAVPFFYHADRNLRRVPILGRPLAGLIHYLFPVNRQPDPEARLLDTFDWYSPKYQSKHTYEQVFRWFEDCGLEDLHVGEVAIAVRGRKPASGRSATGTSNGTS